jgi:2-dehydro-3-deoxyphosphooctonate aldolase (KDO 8-P synthase)
MDLNAAAREHSAVEIAGLRVGPREPLALIAGPCVVEDTAVNDEIAARLVALAAEHALSLIFKASYEKDNRSSAAAYRGPGVADGLAELSRLKARHGVATVTDVHRVAEVAEVAACVDLVQVPALLARQSSLLEAIAPKAKAVHLKKGQSMTVAQTALAVEKLRLAGAEHVIVCERGSSFSPGRLVCDFGAFAELQKIGVCSFDAGHASNERGEILALAAAGVAVGADALFLECHPEPARARCDGGRMVSLDELELALPRLVSISKVVRANQTAELLAETI